MRRNYILYLEDILTSANKIQNYVGNASFEELIKVIKQYIESHNQNPKIFAWTASVQSIMSKISISKEALVTLQ